MAMVLVCDNIFDGRAEVAAGPGEVLVDGDRIVEVAASVGRPAGAAVVDLTERTHDARVHRLPRASDDGRFGHLHLALASAAARR
jgi:hypothetical protein